jgi:hypothetical protein
MKFKNLLTAFHLIFYPGSFVKNDYYEPFLQKLKHKIPIESVSFRTNPFLPLATENNNTILMAHSFGGYKALNDYLYNSTNIEKIVLLSSHTNYAGKVPYPSIDERKINVPLLIHCGTKDRRIPFSVLLQDFWKQLDEPYIHFKSKYIFQKSWTHFQAFEKDSLEESTKDVAEFITNEQDSESIEKTKYEYSFKPYMQLPYFHNIDFDLCFLDSLLKIITNPIHHKWLHHIYFLCSTPSDFYTLSNTDFTNSFLIKTTTVEPAQIEEGYKTMFYDESIVSKVVFSRTTIPPTVFGLYVWLMGSPSIKKKENTLNIEYYYIHFPAGKNYYKIPSPKRYLTKFFSFNK